MWNFYEEYYAKVNVLLAQKEFTKFFTGIVFTAQKVLSALQKKKKN